MPDYLRGFGFVAVVDVLVIITVRVIIVLAVVTIAVVEFIGFQHGVGIQRLLYFLLQIQSRQLQQADSLLQLRRHGQLLTHF